MNRIVRGLGALVLRAPVIVVVVGVLLTVVLGYFSGQQVQVTGNEGFSPDNAELQALERAGELFGTGESVQQVVVSTASGEAFTPEAYRATQAVRDAIASSPVAPYLSAREGREAVLSYLAPLDFAAEFTGQDPSTLNEEALRETYRQAYAQTPPEQQDLFDALVSDAGDASEARAPKGLLLIFLDTSDVPDGEVIALQEQLGAAVRSANLPAGAQADPFAFELLFAEQDIQAEITRLFGLAALIILVILAFVFVFKPREDAGLLTVARRTIADVALALGGIFMAISWTYGLGVLLGPDYAGVMGYFNPVTQIVQILLIGLGVDYAIHLTSRYREEVGQGASVGGAVALAVGTVGVALVLATVTTAVGFLTNLTNPLPALRDFGILAAIGITCAFLVLVTIVPAIRLLLDRRAERRECLPRAAMASSRERTLPELMSRSAVLAERVPYATLGVTVLLALAGGYGLSQLETSFSFTDFVDQDDPILATYDTITEEFGGGFGEATDVVFTGDVATPEFHNALVDSIERMREVPDVRQIGGRPGVEAPVTLLAQLLAGEPDPRLAAAAQEAGLGEDLRVAEDADVAALYSALLVTAPDRARTVLAEVGDGFSARAGIQTGAGQERAGQLRENLDEALAPVEATGVGATVTSQAIVSDVITDEISASQVNSLIITLVVAMVLLVVTFWARVRRPLLGVLTVAPVGLVLLWTFGLMAALGIPFGPVTATISALAIGIGVPFTIHVAIRFQEDRSRFDNPEDAIRSTARFTGGALAGSAFTTMAGFGVLAFSSLVPFRQLGIVTAIAIGCSLVAAVLVLPSLLVLWDRYHRRRDHEVAAVRPAVTGAASRR